MPFIYGGMAGGAVSGGLEGGWKGALQGALVGGALGAVAGWGLGTFGDGFGLAMLGAGAVHAGATDSWDSFAGGIAGGIAGSAAGSGIKSMMNNNGKSATTPLGSGGNDPDAATSTFLGSKKADNITLKSINKTVRSSRMGPEVKFQHDDLILGSAEETFNPIELLLGGGVAKKGASSLVNAGKSGPRWFRANILSISEKAGSSVTTVLGRLKYISRNEIHVNWNASPKRLYTKSIKWNETHLFDWH